MTKFNVWHIAFDVIWLLLLLLLFLHFWRKRQLLVEAKSWLKTKGHITHCEWAAVGHSIWPKIEYTYTVYEQKLVGHYLFLDTAHNNPSSAYSRRIAYRVATAFQSGVEVDVYYNPNHPQQSALDVTIPFKLTLILCLILILFLSTALRILGLGF